MTNPWKKWLLSGLLLASYGMTDLQAADMQADVQTQTFIVRAAAYQIPYAGNESAFRHRINPGYGSALALKAVHEDGTIEFYAVTDRGPNGDTPKYMHQGKQVAGKFFPTPNFTPSIGVITVHPRTQRAEITASVPLKVNGKRISGLPVAKGMTGSTNEIALSLAMQNLGTDTNGLDPEGIAVDRDGNFWISDEYGPFIVKADKHGNILEKYAPGKGLPSILASRVPNRGSEGLTIDERGHIFALIQSPLNVDGKTAKTAKYTRIVELDPATKETKMYAYPVDTGYKNPGKAKLGDITSIGNGQFLIIEQGKQNGAMQNRIYKVDLRQATVLENNGDLEYGRLEGKIKPAAKELVLDLRAHGWNTEKAEGLVLLPDRRTIAVINDNDFGITIGVTDPARPNADVTDYSYDAATGTVTDKDGKKVPQAKFYLRPNDPSEQETRLLFFTLPHSL